MTSTRVSWIISIILVIFILLLINYSEQSLKIHPSYQKSSMNKLYLTHKDGDAVQWELSADNAVIPLGNNEVFLHSISLKINRSPEIFLVSGKGVYNVDKGNVVLYQPVELKMEDRVFTTSTVTWDSKTEVISTEKPVQFAGKNFLIRGNGLNAHINQQKVKILGNVKAVFYH